VTTLVLNMFYGIIIINTVFMVLHVHLHSTNLLQYNSIVILCDSYCLLFGQYLTEMLTKSDTVYQKSIGLRDMLYWFCSGVTFSIYIAYMCCKLAKLAV